MRGNSFTITEIKVDTYEGAVEWAVANLRHEANLRLGAGDWHTDRLARDVGEWALFHCPEALLTETGQSHLAHLAARLGCATILESGRELPAPAKAWLIEYLAGLRPEPKRSRRRPTDWGHALYVSILVDRLETKGWRPMRSNGENRRGETSRSACDIVAEAHRRLGLQLSSYDGVRKLYSQCKNFKLFDRFSDHAALLFMVRANNID